VTTQLQLINIIIIIIIIKGTGMQIVVGISKKYMMSAAVKYLAYTNISLDTKNLHWFFYHSWADFLNVYFSFFSMDHFA